MDQKSNPDANGTKETKFEFLQLLIRTERDSLQSHISLGLFRVSETMSCFLTMNCVLLIPRHSFDLRRANAKLWYHWL